jgi:hypothetical protein
MLKDLNGVVGPIVKLLNVIARPMLKNMNSKVLALVQCSPSLRRAGRSICTTKAKGHLSLFDQRSASGAIIFPDAAVSVALPGEVPKLSDASIDLFPSRRWSNMRISSFW